MQRKAPELAHIAASLVEQAGPIALQYFRHSPDVTDKSEGQGFDPVTLADRTVERFLRVELQKRFPDHGVLGEEEGRSGPSEGPCWILDPIDGTRAFISGMPAWGTLLGLLDGERCVAGAMHQPFTGETFFGCSEWARMRDSYGEGALRAGSAHSLADAILYSTDPAMFATEAERSAFEAVAQKCRMRRFGGDCYSFCLLAAGHIDLVLDNGLQPYDIIPLIPIIEGAGGIVTDARGESALEGGFVVAAANPTLHSAALEGVREGMR